MSYQSIPPELSAALRKVRAVRADRPDVENGEPFAVWCEVMAETLDDLSGVVLFEEDRERAVDRASVYRAEAIRIRSQLHGG